MTFKVSDIEYPMSLDVFNISTEGLYLTYFTLLQTLRE